jgi:hypothetical protein
MPRLRSRRIPSYRRRSRLVIIAAVLTVALGVGWSGAAPVRAAQLARLTATVSGTPSAPLTTTVRAARPAPFAAPATQTSPRPVVLLVHGRGLLGRDTTLLRRSAQRSLEAGARALTGQPLLADGDVRLVWYADVLDPRSAEGCDYAPDDRRARRIASADGELALFASQIGDVLGTIASFLSDDTANVEFRAIAGDLAYVSDARKRCAAERRLTSALVRASEEHRPVVMVAHSFGSIVAYDRLTAPYARAGIGRVERLVTVGAMIGVPDLRRILFGDAAADSLTLPATVGSWVNVRNPGDALAAPLSLPGGAAPTSAAISELLTTDSGDAPDAHELDGYLRDPVTARAVLSAWCAAFGRGAPAGCEALRDTSGR